MGDAGIRIYRASEADKDAAWSIVTAYNEEIGVIVRDTPEGFAKYFNPDSGLWLAEQDTSSGKKVVGCIILRPIHVPGVERTAEVKRLYVLPEARGLRIADKLLEQLDQFAKEQGYEWVYLDTKDDLTAAIKFYRRMGYEDCERYNDNPQATMFMRKKVE